MQANQIWWRATLKPTPRFITKLLRFQDVVLDITMLTNGKSKIVVSWMRKNRINWWKKVIETSSEIDRTLHRLNRFFHLENLKVRT